MIWENTKLLLRLFYRPVSAMSAIIDKGNWLYAAVLVAALSILMQFALTSRVYSGYEAVYRQLEKPKVEQLENDAQTRLPHSQTTSRPISLMKNLPNRLSLTIACHCR